MAAVKQSRASAHGGGLASHHPSGFGHRVMRRGAVSLPMMPMRRSSPDRAARNAANNLVARQPPSAPPASSPKALRAPDVGDARLHQLGR